MSAYLPFSLVYCSVGAMALYLKSDNFRYLILNLAPSKYLLRSVKYFFSASLRVKAKDVTQVALGNPVCSK